MSTSYNSVVYCIILGLCNVANMDLNLLQLLFLFLTVSISFLFDFRCGNMGLNLLQLLFLFLTVSISILFDFNVVNMGLNLFNFCSSSSPSLFHFSMISDVVNMDLNLLQLLFLFLTVSISFLYDFRCDVVNMDLNLLQLLFLFLTVSIVVVGSLINSLEKHLPKALIQSFRYGKFALDLRHSTFVAYLEVPKRYFQHFYILSSFLSTVAFYLCFKTFVLGYEVHPNIISFLDLLGGSHRRATTSATSVFLCIVLITLQCYRRLYETSCVSVFSNSRINISHYIVGHLHYFGTIMSMLLEAPGFTTPSFQYRTLLDVSDITVYVASATALFLWAWHQQYRSAQILQTCVRYVAVL
ncbi:hypothetical protein WDU94_010462 [Cyamophila willieti]